MRKLCARRPSPALVISLIALFVAMGGTGYAALKLPRNSVGSKQIRTGAVGSSEVKNGALRRRDFAAGQLSAGPRGPVGPAGTNGINGHDGATGPRGPSDAWVSASGGPSDNSNSASVTVPAGDYVAGASGQVLYYRGDSTYPITDAEVTCTLASAADSAHSTGTFATVPAHGFLSGSDQGGLATVSQNSAFHLPSGGTITYTCSNATAGTKDPAATMQYSNMRVTAIQVGALH
jgi:hypothetical protein